jgi:hypothetical protein
MAIAPRLIRLRYSGRCAACRAELSAGATARWDAASKVATCQTCVNAESVPDEPRVEAEGMVDAGEAELVDDPIDLGVAGASALREYERRKARREEKLKKNLGRLLGGVVLGITDDPQSTRAWDRGASGEEKLALAIVKLGRNDVVALHDRSVPGSRANIDHIVIAPSGVYVIDSKHYNGEVTVRDVGGLFRTDKRLFVGRHDCSKLARAMAWQVETVTNVLVRAGIDPLPLITPVLAFIDAEWPLLFPPKEFEGVKLEGRRSIVKYLSAPGALEMAAVQRHAKAIAAALPAK